MSLVDFSDESTIRLRRCRAYAHSVVVAIVVHSCNGRVCSAPSTVEICADVITTAITGIHGLNPILGTAGKNDAERIES